MDDLSFVKKFFERIKKDTDYYSFWQDLLKFCKSFKIPDEEEFVSLLPIFYRKFQNDAGGISFYNSLTNFSEKNPANAIRIWEIIEADKTKETLEFGASILIGISKANTNYPVEYIIRDLLQAPNEIENNTGVRSAYGLKVNPKSSENTLLFFDKYINQLLTEKPDKNLGIISRFYLKYLFQIPGAKDKIKNLLEKKNIEVLGEVARSLNEEFKPEDDLDFFNSTLKHLSSTPTEYENVYRTIIYRLENLINNKPEIIVEFLESWILYHNRNLKNIGVLKSLVYKLHQNHQNLIGQLFLRWLNSDQKLFKEAMQPIISDLSYHVNTISLPKNDLDKLSCNDCLYVCYMIVGHILDQRYSAEMLYNILESKYKYATVKTLISSLFVNYLIINYYSVVEILKHKRKNANKTIKLIIDQIIDTSDDYYKRVVELDSIKEFEPSEERMNYFFKQQNLQFSDLIKKSKKKENSFLDMATNIQLRAGKSFFSKYEGEYTEERELQNIRSSVEVARVQFIDEIGQIKLRLIWQNTTRDGLSNE